MGAIDPQTWADAEDGRSLRELRDAAGARGIMFRVECWYEDDWSVAVIDPLDDSSQESLGESLREAADAARAALVKR